MKRNCFQESLSLVKLIRNHFVNLLFVFDVICSSVFLSFSFLAFLIYRCLFCCELLRSSMVRYFQNPFMFVFIRMNRMTGVCVCALHFFCSFSVSFVCCAEHMSVVGNTFAIFV